MTVLEEHLSRKSFSIQNDPKVSYKANKKNPWSQNCHVRKAWLILMFAQISSSTGLGGCQCLSCSLSPLSGPGCGLQAHPPHLPGHSCSFRAQSWLMAAGESLGSSLKSAPLESKKGDCCIPVCPWDLCKVWAGQPALFTIWAAVLAQAGVLATFICLAGK